MRGKLTVALAVLASVFFAGATIAGAEDTVKKGYAGWTSETKDVGVKMGGQVWTRYEAAGQAGLNKDTAIDQSVNARVRLDADAKVNDSTSAFIQLQSVRTWGTATNTTTGTAGTPNQTTSPAGSGNAALAVSDQDASVGVHQAYVKIKNFFTIPVDLQLGRQEVVLDGHRLIGNVWWTMGGRSHDALRLTHAHGDHTFVYVFSKAGEGGRGLATGDVKDTFDVNAHVLWSNHKNLLHANSGLSLYFIAVDANGFDINGSSANTVATVSATTGLITNGGATAKNNIYLIGGRQEGKDVAQLFGIDYRVEGYYEFGQAETDASLAGNALTTNYYTSAGKASGVGSGVDRRAYMFGVRAGKTFKDVTWTPNATIWYDHLSGTNDDDVNAGRFGSFNTLFHTGHKYYGYMDFFVNSANMGTNYLGLRDLAGKFSVKPIKDTTVNLDMHAFWTDTNLKDNPGIQTAIGIPSGAAAANNHLGEEMDLTIAHKYNANVNMTVGYSHFWADDLMHAISPSSGTGSAVRTAGASQSNSGNADWAYVMMDVLF